MIGGWLARSRFETSAIQRHFRVVGGKTPPSDDPTNWDGDVRWATPVDLRRVDGDFIADTERLISQKAVLGSGMKVVPAGSVILSCRAPIGYVAIATQPMATNQGCKALIPITTASDVRFLRYQLEAARPTLEAMGRGSTFVEISTQDTSEFPIAVPDFQTQRRVADFLDAQMVRIDALSARSNKALELLDEHELASVAHQIGDAGLMRTRRWPLAHLRLLDAHIQTGPFGSQLHAEDYISGGWPVCNPSNLVDGRLVADPLVTISDEKREQLRRHILREGDVVFGRRGEMGRAAVVGPDEVGWVCGTGCLRVRFFRHRFLPGFLREVLSSYGVRAWFDKMAVGSTMSNLNEDVIGDLPVPVVPIEDQYRILKSIGELRRAHEALRWRMRKQNELLLERRDSLITATVTGQIDV